MKIKEALVLCILLPQLASAETDNYAVKFNIGVVEGWRASPDAIIRHCNRLDPEGIERRDAAYKAWTVNNEETLKKVNQNTEAIIPIIMPVTNPQIDSVKAVRAYIYIEALKPNFLGKGDEESKLFCKSYTPDASMETMQKITNALAELEKWRVENNVPLR